MIYSKKLAQYVPVQIMQKQYDLKQLGRYTKYTVMDNKIPVGYVDLQDLTNGVYVGYIKNLNENLYSGFGKLADQLEVEHCLHRGIKHPLIKSLAQTGTLIKHFKRGKRFIDEGINVVLAEITKNLRKGELVDVTFLGSAEMFMPAELLQKCITDIKKQPLLK